MVLTMELGISFALVSTQVSSVLFAGFVNHVQKVLNMIVVEGFHFSPEVLKILITAFWYAAFHGATMLLIFLMLYALPSRPKGARPYSRSQLLLASLLSTVVSWVAINIYVKILMLIQTAMVTRMSIFYGSLAFLPLMLFLIFGVWSIILCGNSLVWTICHWPAVSTKSWRWEGNTDGL